VRRSKKRTTKKAQRPQFPRWFKSDHNQAVAEWLAFNFYLDRLAGREPSPDVEPYSQFKRSTVVAFLAMLREMTTNAPIIASQVTMLAP
jgi:hypothetical protein